MNKTLSISTLLTLALTLAQPLKADCAWLYTVYDTETEMNTSQIESTLQQEFNESITTLDDHITGGSGGSGGTSLADIYGQNDTPTPNPRSLGEIYDEINSLKSTLADRQDKSVLRTTNSNPGSNLTTLQLWDKAKAILSGDTTQFTDEISNIADVNTIEQKGMDLMTGPSGVITTALSTISNDLTSCTVPNLNLGADLNVSVDMDLPTFKICDYGKMFGAMKSQVNNMSLRNFGGRMSVNGTNLFDSKDASGALTKGLLHGALLDPTSSDYASGQASFTAAVNVVPLSMGQVMMGAYLTEDTNRATAQAKATSASLDSSMALQYKAADTRRQEQDYNTTNAVVDQTKLHYMAEKRNGAFQDAVLQGHNDDTQREQLRDEAAAKKQMTEDFEEAAKETRASLDDE